MEMWLNVVVLLAVFTDGTKGEKQIDSFIVLAEKRQTSEVFCLGGIVSSRTVITACSCIGNFLFEQKLNYYVFNEFDSRNSVLKTTAKETFEIEHTIINGHCTPSKWDKDKLHFNLGGWKIESSFDLERYAILQPIKETNIKLKDVFDGKLLCYTIGYDNAHKSPIAVLTHVQKDQLVCLNRYCSFISKGKDVDCEKMQNSVLNGPNKCGLLDMGAMSEFMTGAPFFCKADLEYYLLGVTLDHFSNVFFWTRIDVDPNYAFYRSVYMGKNIGDRLRLYSALLILPAFKPTMLFHY